MLHIFPSHMDQERLKQRKTNCGEGRAKTGDSFPSYLPAPKCTHHTNPPKTSPGRFCSSLLLGFRLILSGTNWEQRLLPVPAPALRAPLWCLHQGTAQHQGTQQGRDHCLAPALLQNPSGTFSAISQLRSTVWVERGRILPAPGQQPHAAPWAEPGGRLPSDSRQEGWAGRGLSSRKA